MFEGSRAISSHLNQAKAKKIQCIMIIKTTPCRICKFAISMRNKPRLEFHVKHIKIWGFLSIGGDTSTFGTWYIYSPVQDIITSIG